MPRGAVATALANLASAGVVGIRERPHVFAEDLEQIMRMPQGAVQIAPLLPPVQALAERLLRLPETEVLLKADLDIYGQVKTAVAGGG
ncbi:hypothetical protein ACETRX_35285 [Labrys portucalensis]|uniref:Uncharacterized protein n=1 Tax=Labrys neptuniae TaxID=376174 RepID=A0ABV6ZRS0_9HYPH